MNLTGCGRPAASAVSSCRMLATTKATKATVTATWTTATPASLENSTVGTGHNGRQHSRSQRDDSGRTHCFYIVVLTVWVSNLSKQLQNERKDLDVSKRLDATGRAEASNERRMKDEGREALGKVDRLRSRSLMYRIVSMSARKGTARRSSITSPWMLEVEPSWPQSFCLIKSSCISNKGPGHPDPVCRLVQTITAHTDVDVAPLITVAYEDVSSVSLRSENAERADKRRQTVKYYRYIPQL